jgi:hypothetical protein
MSSVSAIYKIRRLTFLQGDFMAAGEKEAYCTEYATATHAAEHH